MTKFSQIELIYNQLNNLVLEIEELVENEDYLAANEKVKAKDKLIKKFFLAKKTVEATEEEKEKITVFEDKIRLRSQALIDSLKEEHKLVAEELGKLKKKSKVDSAYEIRTHENTGSIVDAEE